MNGNNSSGGQKFVQFTEEQKLHIKYNLEKSLGPEYVSFRPAAGGSEVIYIEGWKLLNLANQIFGFNGWSSEVRSTQVDYVDNMGGKWSLGLSSIVRVTLKDGTYHEDIGYGHIENCRTKPQAFEKAKKEAITDAVKRALRQFGNVLGNCLYEKNYIQRVKQVKKIERLPRDDQLLRPEDNVRPQFDENGRLIKPKTVKPQQTHNQLQKLPTLLPQLPAKTDNVQPLPTTTTTTNVDKIIPEDSYMDDSFLFSDEVFDDVELDHFPTTTPLLAARKPQETELQTPEPNKLVNDTTAATTTPLDNDKAAAAAAPIGFVSTRLAKDIISNGPMKSPLPASDSLAFNPQVRTPLHHRNTLDPTKSAPVKRTPLTQKRTSQIPSARKPLTENEDVAQDEPLKEINNMMLDLLLNNDDNNAAGQKRSLAPISRRTGPSKRARSDE